MVVVVGIVGLIWALGSDVLSYLSSSQISSSERHLERTADAVERLAEATLQNQTASERDEEFTQDWISVLQGEGRAFGSKSDGNQAVLILGCEQRVDPPYLSMTLVLPETAEDALSLTGALYSKYSDTAPISVEFELDKWNSIRIPMEPVSENAEGLPDVWNVGRDGDTSKRSAELLKELVNLMISNGYHLTIYANEIGKSFPISVSTAGLGQLERQSKDLEKCLNV